MKKDIEIAEVDGNDFHYKVKKVFVDLGWNVKMSPYHNDAFSEKPREIDIIAEKIFLPERNSIYHSAVIVRFFVECKYIKDKTTFWFQERNKEKAKKVIDFTRLFHEVEKNSLVQSNHHYLVDNLIAKLYKTESKNLEGDPVYKAITQCLNASIYYRKRSTDLKNQYRNKIKDIKEVNYQIIVCNSYEKFIKKNTISDCIESIDELFQLEVDYAYTEKEEQKEELFYIDVLSIEKIKEFEENVLLKEINLIRQKISDDNREAEFYRQQNQGKESDFDPYSIF